MTEDKPKPHGVTTISFEVQELDFKSAIEFIKNQLDRPFLITKWSSSLKDAIRASSVCKQSEDFEQLEDSKGPWCSLSDPFEFDGPETSVCWFSVKLLNVLWDLLFGRTTGTAPWHDILKGLAPCKANGSADHMMNMEKAKQEIFKDLDGVEAALSKALGKHFPMKILMPKTITPERSTRASLGTASNSTNQPPVNQPTSTQLPPPTGVGLSKNKVAPPLPLQPPPPSQPPLMKMNQQQQLMVLEYLNRRRMLEARCGQQPMMQQYPGQQPVMHYPAMPYATMQQPMTQQVSGKQQTQKPPVALSTPPKTPDEP